MQCGIAKEVPRKTLRRSSKNPFEGRIVVVLSEIAIWVRTHGCEGLFSHASFRG